MYLGEYLVHSYWIWSQSCRYTFPLHTVDQLVKSPKKLDAVYLSNRESDIVWMEEYQIVKTRVCLRRLLSKFLRSSSQFYQIQVGGWPGEVLHVTKTKTVRKWELNTSDEL